MGGATSRDIDAAATALASLAAADSTQEFIHLADEHKSVIDRFSSAGSSLRHSTCPLLLLDALDTGLRLLHSSSVSSSTGQQAGSRRARGAAAAAAANAARQNDELVHRLTQVLHAVLAWSWKLGPDTEMQWAGEAMEHMQASGFIAELPSTFTSLADRLQSQAQQLRGVLQSNPSKMAAAQAGKFPLLTNFLVSHMVLLYRTCIMGAAASSDPDLAEAVKDLRLLAAVGSAVASVWRAWPVMQLYCNTMRSDGDGEIGRQLYFPVIDFLIPLVQSLSDRLPAAPAERLRGDHAAVLATAADLQWVVMVLLTLRTQHLSQEQQGLSPFPLPAHSSSDSAAGSRSSSSSSSSRRRRPGARQGSDSMLAVPLYHAAVLNAVQLVDLPGAELMSPNADVPQPLSTSDLVHAACMLLHYRADSAQQQQAGGSRSAGSASSHDKMMQLLPSFVPVLFELAALQPFEEGVMEHCLLASSSAMHVMQAAHEAQGGRRNNSRAARAADPYLRCLAGLWQPLVQLVVPVLQHAGLADSSACPSTVSMFPLIKDSMEVLLELDSSPDSQQPSAHFFTNFGVTCSSLEVAVRSDWSAAARAPGAEPPAGPGSVSPARPVLLQEVGLVQLIPQALASHAHIQNLITDSSRSLPLLSLLLSCTKRLHVSVAAVAPRHAMLCAKLAVAAADTTAVAMRFLAACDSGSGSNNSRSSSGAGNTPAPVSAVLQDTASARSQWLLLAGRALHVLGTALQAACDAASQEEAPGVVSGRPAAAKDASGLELVPVAAFTARLGDSCLCLQSVLQSAGPQPAALLPAVELCIQLCGTLGGVLTQPRTQQQTQQQCQEQWQRMLADGDTAGRLGSGLVSCAGLLCAALPSSDKGCCNTGCFNLDTPSELQLAAESSKCSGCRIAKYCCVECLQQHWKAHKAACRALAAPSGRSRGRSS